MTSVPSLSRGTNSEPRLEARGSSWRPSCAPTTTSVDQRVAAAPGAGAAGRASGRAGRRTSPSPTASAAGRARRAPASASATGPSTPVRAKMTVRAIGRNSFPSTPCEREDRQIHDHDDELAEHRRLADLDGGVADDVELRPARCGRGPGAGRSSRPSRPSYRPPGRSRWRPGSSGCRRCRPAPSS